MAAQSSFSLSNFEATPDQIRTGFASIVGNNSLFTDLKTFFKNFLFLFLIRCLLGVCGWACACEWRCPVKNRKFS